MKTQTAFLHSLEVVVIDCNSRQLSQLELLRDAFFVLVAMCTCMSIYG